MSLQPGKNPYMETFGGLLGVIRDTATTAGQVVAGKWLIDLSDGELPISIDPSNPNGTFGVGRTNTVGSATPVSIWRSYDMLLIGVGAVLIVGALALRK